MSQIKTWIVSEEEAKERIDKYLAERCEFSRSRLQQLIEEGAILVNGEIAKARTRLKAKDRIELQEPELVEAKAVAQQMDLDILYEDEDVIVINKPKGMVVHPGAGNWDHTLVNGLLYHCKDLSGINGELRPGIVHRIDKDTTGCLVACKNDKAHENIAKQLENKTCHREYIALVEGVISHEKGTVHAPIGRDLKNRQNMTVTDVNAKDAVTHFEVMERFNEFTLIRCHLETGRTHQIRVHMKYAGFPVVGDERYGKKSKWETKGQMLHAYKLTFVHPTTQQTMSFEAPLPSYFEAILQELREEKA